MKFALQEAELMGIIDGDETSLIAYIMKQKNDLLAKNAEDRIERRDEVLRKWRTNDKKVVGKIGRMCVKAVQMKFQSGWDAKTTWDSLKERYTPQGWSFNEFETYVTVLNEQARKDKKLSELNELLKSLKEEENRMKGTVTVAAVRSERGEYRGRGGRGYSDRSNSGKDDGSGRLYCKICFQNHEEKCHHVKMKCYKCHKSGHIARNCSNNRKDAESTSPASQGSESGSTERKQVIDMIRNNIAQFSSNENIEFIE